MTTTMPEAQESLCRQGRVSHAPTENYEPIFGPDAQAHFRILSQSPPIALAVREYMRAMYMDNELPARLIELIRIRVAFHVQCRTCMATRNPESGVNENLVCELAQPDTADDLTDAEKVALHYADLLATDHMAITDATYDELRKHFEEPRIVELGALICAIVGTGRMLSSWDITVNLPANFQTEQGKVHTPWGTDEVIVNEQSMSGKYVLAPVQWD